MIRSYYTRKKACVNQGDVDQELGDFGLLSELSTVWMMSGVGLVNRCADFGKLGIIELILIFGDPQISDA
jgi:hypothetical protein